MKKLVSFFTIFIFSLTFASAQKMSVDFFGIYSNSGDKNMIEMTHNIYFSQLRENTNITVTDKSSKAVFESTNDIITVKSTDDAINNNAETKFFVQIETTESGLWLCFLHLDSTTTDKNCLVKKEYSSYYKILTEAKNAIEEILNAYTQDYSESTTAEVIQAKTATLTEKTSAESLAGTWYGETFIDKIVIFRGGRGFIIYKNGASMNISIQVQNTTENTLVNIIQLGKPNASFYPELPRTIALEIAPTAEPLEWKLTLIDSNTLEGIKKTLIEDESSDSGVTTSETSVVWTRK